MDSEVSVPSLIDPPTFGICERYNPEVGPELAKALSILTRTSAVPGGLACSYNSDSSQRKIILPWTIVTANGDSASLPSLYDRRDRSQLPTGVITGEAWAIKGASGKVSHFPYSDIVLLANDQGKLTECSKTIGEIATHNGKPCMALYTKLPSGQEREPFAWVIPDTTHGDGVADTKGNKESGWSITSIRSRGTTSGPLESGARASADGVDSALNV